MRYNVLNEYISGHKFFTGLWLWIRLFVPVIQDNSYKLKYEVDIVDDFF